VSRGIVIAYWLMPAEPARRFFYSLIANLARRYDAPVFEPHVTIHVGKDDASAAEIAVAKAGRDFKTISAKSLAIDQSDQLIKTLFVQFAMNERLQQLNAMIRNAAKDSCEYELNPHLSLLYKNIPTTARRELADSIKLSFSEVLFDGLRAVRCISPTRNRADIEGWRVVATRTLLG
jgi:cyclic phosphodiesterase-like protein